MNQLVYVNNPHLSMAIYEPGQQRLYIVEQSALYEYLIFEDISAAVYDDLAGLPIPKIPELIDTLRRHHRHAINCVNRSK